MYISNYHSHNVFCDGRAPMEDFVKFAIAKGVNKYGFSSHSPLPFHTSWNMELDNLPYYKSEFFRLKKKYAGQIELYLGLEMDYIPGVFGVTQNALYDTSDLDYRISSIHYLDPLPNGGFFSVDGNIVNFKKGLKSIYKGDIRTAAKRFFEVSGEMVMTGGFEIVGHIDKISQNGSLCEGFNISEKWYIDEVRALFELVKQKGLFIEINTKSYLEKGFTYPDVQFFPLLKQMEISIIVSSDCHYPDKILYGFEPVYKLLKAVGIDTSMQFNGETWEESSLDINSPFRGLGGFQ